MFKRLVTFVFNILFLFLSVFSSVRAYDPPKEAINLGVQTLREAPIKMISAYMQTYRCLQHLQESGLLSEALDPEASAVPVVFSVDTILCELFNNSESREYSFAKRISLLINFLGFGKFEETYIRGMLSAPYMTPDAFYRNLLKICKTTELEVHKRALQLMAEIYNARFKQIPGLFPMP